MEWEIQDCKSPADFIEAGKQIASDNLIELKQTPWDCTLFNLTLGMIHLNILDDEIVKAGVGFFGRELLECILLETLDQALLWHQKVGQYNGNQFGKKHSAHINRYKRLPKQLR